MLGPELPMPPVGSIDAKEAAPIRRTERDRLACWYVLALALEAESKV